MNEFFEYLSQLLETSFNFKKSIENYYLKLKKVFQSIKRVETMPLGITVKKAFRITNINLDLSKLLTICWYGDKNLCNQSENKNFYNDNKHQ